jgi:amidase
VGQDWTGEASFNSIWTFLQVPVVSVPGLVGPSGLPLGMSLVARRYEDRKAIAMAGLLGALLVEQRVAA